MIGRLVLDLDRFYPPLSELDPVGATTAITWDTHGVGVAEVEDALGHLTTAGLDLQALASTAVTGANRTAEAALSDAHGRVIAVCRSRPAGPGASTAGESDVASMACRRWRTVAGRLPSRTTLVMRPPCGSVEEVCCGGTRCGAAAAP